MLVELGNPRPKNVGHDFPCVTYIHIPDHKTFDPSVNIEELRAHLYEADADNDGVTHRPNDESLLDVIRGVWQPQGSGKPSWVWAENDAFAQALAAWYNCPVGRPEDVEDTHYTKAGAPGIKMSDGPTALLVNSGNDIVSRTLGGLIVGFNKATATAATSGSLTATGTPFVSSAYIGCTVVDLTTGVYGIIESNTTSVLTVDRWYNPATPGGAAGTTPGATDTYAILSGGPPAWFMGLGNTNTSPSAGDTTMSGEITTSGGGLIRAIATYAHTASATTFTLANTFTANGTDSLPVTVYRIGIFISMVSGWAGSMMCETTLNASATLTASGDQLTVTETETV